MNLNDSLEFEKMKRNEAEKKVILVNDQMN